MSYFTKDTVITALRNKIAWFGVYEDLLKLNNITRLINIDFISFTIKSFYIQFKNSLKTKSRLKKTEHVRFKVTVKL